MENLAKVKLLLGVSDSAQDKLLELLLDDSRERLTAYISQDVAHEVTYPSSLDWLLRELTVRRFNRIGDEGKKSSTESDVSATWSDDDVADFAVYLDKHRVKRGGLGIARFF